VFFSPDFWKQFLPASLEAVQVVLVLD